MKTRLWQEKRLWSSWSSEWSAKTSGSEEAIHDAINCSKRCILWSSWRNKSQLISRFKTTGFSRCWQSKRKKITFSAGSHSTCLLQSRDMLNTFRKSKSIPMITQKKKCSQFKPSPAMASFRRAAKECCLTGKTERRTNIYITMSSMSNCRSAWRHHRWRKSSSYWSSPAAEKAMSARKRKRPKMHCVVEIRTRMLTRRLELRTSPCSSVATRPAECLQTPKLSWWSRSTWRTSFTQMTARLLFLSASESLTQ